MDIDKYEFLDPSIDRAECDDAGHQVLLNLNNDYGGEYLWLPKCDVIALAQALGITGEDLMTKAEKVTLP